jgi:hypothetical protein
MAEIDTLIATTLVPKWRHALRAISDIHPTHGASNGKIFAKDRLSQIAFSQHILESIASNTRKQLFVFARKSGL